MSYYTTYDDAGMSAHPATTRAVRYMRHGKYNILHIFDPDPALWTGPRPVLICWPPGGNMSKGDWDWGSDPILKMFTDDLGGYVVLANGRQGGHYLEPVEEQDMLFSPNLQLESNIVPMFLKANATNSAVFGSTYEAQTEPRYYAIYGTSAGAWRSLWGQLVPRGDMADLADALAVTGDPIYKYDYDHTVGHFFGDTIQCQLTTFSDCLTSTAATYTVNGNMAAGASSITITAGNGQTFWRGNRIRFNGAGQQYAVTADKAGAGTLTLFPPLVTGVSTGATVDVVATGQEVYGDQSWAMAYVGTKSDGRVWRSDDPSGLGVPMDEKLQASLHYLVRADNPRVGELNIMLYRGAGSCLELVNTTSGVRSFWTLRNQATPTVLPDHTNLHDEADAAFLAHSFYLAGGNSPNVNAYIGDADSNPTGTSTEVPWLKGDANIPVIWNKWKTFMRNSSRAGGSIE